MLNLNLKVGRSQGKGRFRRLVADSGAMYRPRVGRKVVVGSE